MLSWRPNIIAVVGLFALAACSTADLQTAQTDIATGIKAACTDVMAAQQLNPGSPAAPWASGACATATAVGALVQTSATLQWLGGLQAQLKPAA